MLRRLPLPPEITRFWTIDEIDLAIGRLERRIRDIEALQANRVRHRAPHFRDVERSIRDTILEIFGIASQQFYRHEYFTIDDGPSIIGADVEDLGTSDEWRQAQFVERIPGAVARIRELVDSLQEKRKELAAPKATPVEPLRRRAPSVRSRPRRRCHHLASNDQSLSKRRHKFAVLRPSRRVVSGEWDTATEKVWKEPWPLQNWDSV